MILEQTELLFSLALALASCIIVFFLIYTKRLQGLIRDLETIRKEVEKESELNIRLLESNENYRKDVNHLYNTLDRLNFPLWLRDDKLNITFCNTTYASIVGKEKEDIINSRKKGEILPTCYELAKSVQEQNILQSVKEHIIVDGDRQLYNFTEIPLPDGGTAGYAVDTSELEEKDHELQNYVAAQSSYLESASSAIAICGPRTRLRFFNKAFANLWRLDEKWLNEKPFYGEVLENLRENRMLPEQINFQEFKDNCLAMFPNLLHKHEEYYYLPDGRVLRVLVIPHNRGGLIFSYEDMTEHITLERSYNTLLSVKKSTLDNLFEGVAVFGEDGKLQLSNPAYTHMWQLNLDILSSNPHLNEIMDITKPLYDDFGDDWKEFKQKAMSLLSKRKFIKQNIKRTDESVLEWVSVPLPDGATLMTYTDITDSFRVEHSLRAEKEALKEADRLKNDFLSSVSYELRSPLTSISGFAEVLLKKYFGTLNDKQIEYVRGIFDSSVKLSALIDNILEISSIDAGNITLEIKEFGLLEVVTDVVEAAKDSTEQRSIYLDFTHQENIGNIHGDEKRIKQVINNILDNAISFTGDGGEISVSIHKTKNDEIAIAIKDNGTGIAIEKRNDVFDRFHKSDNTKGIGLGLPVAKSIIEMHGGHIELESEPDKGTTITCFLKYKNHEKKKNTA